MPQLGLRELGRSPGVLPAALGGMLGAGVFVGPAPAAAAAGGWFLLGGPIAALLAACCAGAAAQQYAVYRGPSAAYACVRARVGMLPARVLASTGLVGHVAAMAAVAGAVAQHLASGSEAFAPGIAAVTTLLVVLASTAGLRIRGRSAWLWLGLTFAVLAIIVAACFAIPPPPHPLAELPSGTDATGVTGAAGVLFFALGGFERVTAPVEGGDRYRRKAVRSGLAVALVATSAIAVLTGTALLHQLGAARLALSPTPVLDALTAASAENLIPLVGTGAALAMLPVLLGILESSRSTTVAIVRTSSLPPVLERIGSNGTPFTLDLVVGLAAVALALILEPVQALSLASCCMLVHYAFVNVGALLLEGERTWVLRSLCLGVGLSVILALSMPVSAMLGTFAVVITGPVIAGSAAAFTSRCRRGTCGSESQDEQ